MPPLKLAKKWEVKVEGSKRSIQLFDINGEKLKGEEAYWEGDFDCSYNKLTSIEGSPKEVGGGFYCDHNSLTSLEGCPKEVGGDFYCNDNSLTSLEGSPKEVGGHFDCHDNKLTPLEGCPKTYQISVGKRILRNRLDRGVLFHENKKYSVKSYKYLFGRFYVEVERGEVLEIKV